MDEVKKLISETGYLTNKKIGIRFDKRYPDIFRKINEVTKDLESTYVVNTTLRARVVFIMSYEGNIELLKKNDAWLTFDRAYDDFIDKTGDYIKRGWDKSKEKLSYAGVYTKKETIEILTKDAFYQTLMGKSKNRTLMKNNPQLYNSIYAYTSCLNELNRNSNSFSTRILFLVKDNGEIGRIQCSVCKTTITSYNHSDGYFSDMCKPCYNSVDNRYPSIGYFKETYGEEWERFYNSNKERIGSLKVNSKTWFIKKYGDIVGLEKYKQDAEKRITNIMTLKSVKFSKISQELFWDIYSRMCEKEQQDCFFHELNHEYFLKDSEGGNFFFLDFKFRDKIIEYDGGYWHTQERDTVRNESYERLGYKLMIITDKDYNRDTKSKSVVNQCLEFLKDE
jgi:hypothetical protein